MADLFKNQIIIEADKTLASIPLFKSNKSFKCFKDIRRCNRGLFGKISGLIVLIYFVHIIPIQAQPLTGAYPETYLLRDVGARAIAMGGAYTAVSNEPSAVFYNPSALAWLGEKPIFTTFYSFLEFGRNHMALSWGQSIAENIGLGFGFNTFNSGSFQGRDVKGNPTTELYSLSYSFTGSFAYSTEFASFGISLKYLSNNLFGTNSWAAGYGIDLGTKFDVAGLFTFGAAVQNISSMMNWHTQSGDNEMLPWTVRSGAAVEIGLNEDEYETRSAITGEVEKVFVPATKYVIVSIETMMRQFERSPKVILGSEVSLHELIAFRGGLALYGEKYGKPGLFPMNHWGGGITLRSQIDGLPFKTNFDYAIASDYISLSGVSHHLSLIFEF